MLALAPFLNDAASEMITPLLPIFLVAILVAGPTAVGVVEGITLENRSVSLLPFSLAVPEQAS